MAILLVVVLGTGKKLGPDVPDDTEHQDFFAQLEQGQRRQEVEQGCQRCHPVAELPQKHPHKEECMVCHQPERG
ncbi:MAG: cytochrome C [Thermodesulfobacteriota bacterium]